MRKGSSGFGGMWNKFDHTLPPDFLKLILVFYMNHHWAESKQNGVIICCGFGGKSHRSVSKYGMIEVV